VQLLRGLDREDLNAVERALGDARERSRGRRSISAVTPRLPMVSMHRSQRTGAATWLTMRSGQSLPVVTAPPSLLDSSVIVGSFTGMPDAAAARAWTAGAMWACAATAASTASSSPPITAVIPVGVIAVASAIARPRAPVSRIASSGDRTPAITPAASSPTLCPAVASGPASCSAASKAAATSSGCAAAASVISSASALVPARMMSIPASSDQRPSPDPSGWRCTRGSP
jgi:hypothetical protein